MIRSINIGVTFVIVSKIPALSGGIIPFSKYGLKFEILIVGVSPVVLMMVIKIITPRKIIATLDMFSISVETL